MKNLLEYMEIQKLRGFHLVAQHKSFSIAAKRSQRTQPTLSLQVKALEEQLGVKLFERTGKKKVQLTPEGELFYELTAALLDRLENIKVEFNEARGLFQTSNIRIVTHRSVMVYLLPNVVKIFKEKFPDCQLSILNRNRDEIISMLEDGQADLGITSATVFPNSLEYTVLGRFNRILIATRGHPLSKVKKIQIEDIAKYPLILPTKESNTRKIIDRLFESKNLSYSLTMEVVGRDAIKTYVGMNLGISLINEYYVSPEDKKKLFVKNLSQLFGFSETGVITKKGRVLSKPMKEFVDLLSSNLKKV